MSKLGATTDKRLKRVLTGIFVLCLAGAAFVLGGVIVIAWRIVPYLLVR